MKIKMFDNWENITETMSLQTVDRSKRENIPI